MLTACLSMTLHLLLLLIRIAMKLRLSIPLGPVKSYAQNCLQAPAE